MIRDAVDAALAKALELEKERAETARDDFEREKAAHVAAAVEAARKEEGVRAKELSKLAVGEAERKMKAIAAVEQERAVQAAEVSAAAAARKGSQEEFETTITKMKEEIAAHARTARLREQMLNAVMTKEVDAARTGSETE